MAAELEAGAAPGALTARQLVAELQRIGAGRWTADAVRQWTREEDPCPIAVVGGQGQANRYELAAVLDWLLARAEREKPRGYSRADGADQAAVLRQAKANLTAEKTPAIAASDANASGGRGPAPELNGFDAEVIDLARALGVTPRAVARAAEQLDIVVTKYRTPQNRKAHEESRIARLKADEMAGRLVPVEEVQTLLSDLVMQVRGELLGMPGPLAQAIEASATPDLRRAQIEEFVHAVLSRLSTQPPPAPPEERDS